MAASPRARARPPSTATRAPTRTALSSSCPRGAGGQGITLTAADTCVIYDSDFNPQNDLQVREREGGGRARAFFFLASVSHPHHHPTPQAMARCHRIGQVKDVTVYRLVCNDTYEQTVFEAASKKYGLDEAILGAAPPGSADDPEATAGRIADLLKHGAVRLDGGGGEEAAAAAGDAFAGEGIDSILAGRTEEEAAGVTRRQFVFGGHVCGGGGGGDAPLAPPPKRASAAARPTPTTTAPSGPPSSPTRWPPAKPPCWPAPPPSGPGGGGWPPRRPTMKPP